MVLTLLAWIGFFILAVRLTGPKNQSPLGKPLHATPWVSIVVPVRNEENNLDKLINSLLQINYPNKEIILVDDLSADRSQEIIRSYPVRLIKGEPLPSGWVGKNWACHQAVPYAKGEILLFTDADTSHEPEGLNKALRFFYQHQADMISALPYHETPLLWEKWLGPFHALLYTATNYLSPRPRRLFAIGQFLMFSKKFYHQMGGHASIRHQYPDDLALANQCLKAGGRYWVCGDTSIYRVRMYSGFWPFVQGWRRNFLAGIQQSRRSAFLEVTAVIFGMTGSGQWMETPFTLIPSLLCLSVIAVKQKSWGTFSFWGVFLFPVSLILYTFITLLAGFDYLTGNKLLWKDRSYEGWKDDGNDIR